MKLSRLSPAQRITLIGLGLGALVLGCTLITEPDSSKITEATAGSSSSSSGGSSSGGTSNVGGAE